MMFNFFFPSYNNGMAIGEIFVDARPKFDAWFLLSFPTIEHEYYTQLWQEIPVAFTIDVVYVACGLFV